MQSKRLVKRGARAAMQMSGNAEGRVLIFLWICI